MPYYEYHCIANGRTLEVRHGMNERVTTWGELAEMAGAPPGTTPAGTPVERLMSVTAPVPGSSGSAGFQGCGSGCACVPE